MSYQGLVSYPGIVNPKGCIYTQTLGVHPDRITIYCTPQNTGIASRGDVTFSYGVSSVTLPDCFFDEIQVVSDVTDGHRVVVTLFDRRERWKLSDTISGQYNTYRAGSQLSWRLLSLRSIVQMLLQYMGEATPDVSALSNSIYPEVRWDDIHPVQALDEILKDWGFSLSLGFNTENVTIVQVGVGATIPYTGDAMMLSSSVDPKVRPKFVRTRFAPSLMQARFLLEAVGLDDDGVWKPISSLSYKPTTWDKEDPVTLPTVKANESEATWQRAVKSVYRTYRIKKFADNTLNVPDGSLTLSNIRQCLPLYARLLDSDAIRTDGVEQTQIPFRIYGKRQVRYNNGEPAKYYTTAVGEEIVGEKVLFNGEDGIIQFEEPQYQVDGSSNYIPAELYLECSFSIFDAASFAYYKYSVDTSLDPSSEGYYTVPFRDLEGRVVIKYDSSHAVTGTVTNASALNAIAALVAASVSVQYSTEGSQICIYCEPKLDVRCDGAITQVQHIISDGTRHAASFTTVSRNVEFDSQIMTRDERTAIRNSLSHVYGNQARVALSRRRDAADD